MKNRFLPALLMLALAGCATTDKGLSSYDELYAQAVSETNVAKQMGFLWRDTEKYLEESRRAFERGEKRRAKELAREALEQARLAQEQARRQANPPSWYPPI